MSKWREETRAPQGSERAGFLDLTGKSDEQEITAQSKGAEMTMTEEETHACDIMLAMRLEAVANPARSVRALEAQRRRELAKAVQADKRVRKHQSQLWAEHVKKMRRTMPLEQRRLLDANLCFGHSHFCKN